MSTIKYSLNYIIELNNKNIHYNIDDKIIDKIKELINKCSSSKYIKKHRFYDKKYNNKKYNNKKYNNKNNDFEIIRNFKSTKILKNVNGIHKHTDIIRNNLNKLTNNTYDTIKDIIINEINNINENNIDDLNKIGVLIFNIASSNSLYSNVYANLFKTLINKHHFMKIILNDNIEKFNVFFQKNDDFDDFNIEENYNKFCDINKENEKRKSISLFYINLMIINIIKKETIINIILNLQNILFNIIKKEKKKNIGKYITDVLYVLITNSYDYLSDCDEWKLIINNIQTITMIKKNKFPSIDNNIIFKHMDIIEEL